ncbi:TetR/AcrR family transcriptional regulator [Nocardioides insulae]|uniref:TetR/AcrR family transcriptional regulator n=1 Tax=Nocardioides insulae TaxID=394734 RepID=UPI00048D7AF0|nr:TetR/AcrR family transcriptional regulator [Nocardioides insulae]
MARPRGDHVREDVVLATFELIANRGVDGMSMRALAEATGLSTGTINYHFGSKRNVLFASIGHGYQQRPRVWDENDPVSNLRRLLHRFELSNHRRQTWWRFWLAVSSYAQADEEVAAYLEARHNENYEKFETTVNECVEQGLFPTDLDTGTVAKTLVNAAYGQAIAQLIGGVEPQDVAACFDRQIQELSRSLDHVNGDRTLAGTP